MTYFTTFDVEWFDAFDATVKEGFVVAGSRRIRLQILREENTEMSGRKFYRARSDKPFVVTVHRRANGDQAHTDGNLRVYIAAHNKEANDHVVNVQYAR